jgi:hypothetical protein
VYGDGRVARPLVASSHKPAQRSTLLKVGLSLLQSDAGGMMASMPKTTPNCDTNKCHLLLRRIFSREGA